MIKRKAAEVLEALDSISEYFRSIGIKGFHHLATYCPVPNYLSRPPELEL